MLSEAAFKIKSQINQNQSIQMNKELNIHILKLKNYPIWKKKHEEYKTMLNKIDCTDHQRKFRLNNSNLSRPSLSPNNIHSKSSKYQKTSKYNLKPIKIMKKTT